MPAEAGSRRAGNQDQCQLPWPPAEICHRRLHPSSIRQSVEKSIQFTSSYFPEPGRDTLPVWRRYDNLTVCLEIFNGYSVRVLK